MLLETHFLVDTDRTALRKFNDKVFLLYKNFLPFRNVRGSLNGPWEVTTQTSPRSSVPSRIQQSHLL